MKKKLLPIVGLLLTLFALTGCGGNQNIKQKAESNTKKLNSPFIFSETEFDFGVIKQSGGIVSYDFEFIYNGDEPIKITATPGSCLCTKGKISANEFKKGDKGVLTVELDPNLHAEPKGKFFKTVVILTEPSIQPAPELKIWAQIDLDLGEEFFKLKAPHKNQANEPKKASDKSEKNSEQKKEFISSENELINVDEISNNGQVSMRSSRQRKIRFRLEAKEVMSNLDDSLTYEYWTYNKTVPAPLMRVKEGDEVTLELSNAEDSRNPHSIDLHAVNGPGGGSVETQVYPGQSKEFTFKATHPGLYVYHCATPDVAQHVANGMYGMILVEPKKGLSKVDKEFYIMQGEFYSILENGERGVTQQSGKKLFKEQPEYVVFNGRKNALTKERALKAKTGDKVRLYVGNGGVSKASSFHVIGEIFDKVYVEGGSLINKNVQTTTIPAGGATIVEFKIDKSGKYLLVDHALSRLNKGALAELIAE